MKENKGEKKEMNKQKQKGIDVEARELGEEEKLPQYEGNFGTLPEGYQEQEDANFFKFEQLGDTMQGKLMVKARSSRYDFFLYTVKVQNGDNIRFHGTQQLDTLLANAVEGDNIFCQYIDNTPTPQGNMKIFKVGIQKQRK